MGVEGLGFSAGSFSAWLRDTRNALKQGTETDVPCGECNACCRSSYFIHIKPEETKTLERMGKEALIPAPGMPAGNMLLGHNKEGACPKLVESKCTVYADRPQTCRNYDCRVFTAAGISAGEDKSRINQRVALWNFEYPTPRDREEHEAVKAAAKFIRENAAAFPGGRVPTDASQQAILAIKVYEIFLEGLETARGPLETARLVIETSKAFDR